MSIADTPADPLSSLSLLPTIETKRLLMRPLSDGDVPALFTIFSDPEVTRYWSRPPMESLDEAALLVREIDALWRSRTLLQWGVTLRGQGEVIGTCTLARWDRRHRRAELGYALARAHQGHGTMAEALPAVVRFGFTRMELHRIGADTDPRNAPSIRTLERLGFVREGLQRESWYHRGEWADGALYGLLAPGP